MVTFMVKWAIASIPAMVILMVLGAFFWAAGIAVFSSFTSPKASGLFTTPKLTEQSKIPENEVSAIASIKDVNIAEMIYASRHPNAGFTANLAMLGSEGTVDNSLASGRKNGYTFIYTPGEKINRAIRSYTITAVPDKVGATRSRSFYSDEAGEIHYNSSGPADATSPVI
jgi:hypothetical protein